MNCEVCSLLGNDTNLVFQTGYWKVFVMDEQSYLGRCVVSCKRHCPSLSELTIDEWKDFKIIANKLESAVKTAFGADLVNWSCLMNNAFRKKPFNPHVHWHFRPRYKAPINFSGKTFTDPDFGEHYRHHRTKYADAKLIQAIITALRKEIDK